VAFERVCRAEMPVAGEGRWGFPTCDVFAGPLKDERKASIFFTKFACEGSAGVNALNHSWQGRTNSVGRALLWVFPPFELIGASLTKLQQEQCDAIVVLPSWDNKYWLPLLMRLNVVSRVELQYHSTLYRVGFLAPAGVHKARYSFTAYRVVPNGC
jgi:hypothetical protein